MATEAPATPELLAKFGPQRGYQAGERLDTSVDPDRLVKTHCCFCGQQCGIQLKVKGNAVVGFEPWLDFPFNKGMLCPKGVRRYLQSSHHDRLTTAHYRDVGAEEEPVRCARCNEPYATPSHVADLIQVEAELGYHYQMSNPACGHYQRICPACRRKMLALAQHAAWEPQSSEASTSGN